MTTPASRVTELLPCPFCGGQSTLHNPMPECALGDWVSCDGCGLEGPTETGVTEAEAIAAWNTRSLSSDSVSDGSKGVDDRFGWKCNCCQTARGYAVTPLYLSPTEPKAGVVSEDIIDAARNLLASKFSTYKARNGRDVGIEDDNGEKCWIVPFDEVFALETALAALNGDKP